MLVERVFEIGGILTVVFGAVLAALVYATGAYAWGVGIFLAPVLMIGFGVFFVWVGRQAREDRRALLALAEAPSAAPKVAGAEEAPREKG